MKITYDSKGDVLYIQLRDAPASHVVDVEPGMVADIGQDERVLGFEILDASTRLTAEELSRVSYEDLVTEQTTEMSLPTVQSSAMKTMAKRRNHSA